MAAGAEPAAVYLSPHLDDVVLSCGGQVAERVRAGETVWVVTVFTADETAGTVSDFAAGLHRVWRLPAPVVEARRREDRAACARLGAVPRHWTELEAIYRPRPRAAGSLYPDRESLFGPVDSADAGLQAALAERIRQLPDSCEVLSPLAVGAHVDHVLVRRAAESALGARLGYYEDYPYVVWQREALAAALAGAEWVERTLPLSRAALESKVQAIAAYTSQLRPLFGGRWRMAFRVRSFARRRGGERVWRRAGSR